MKICDNCGERLIRHHVLGVTHANGQWWCHPGYSLNEYDHATLSKGIIDDCGY